MKLFFRLALPLVTAAIALVSPSRNAHALGPIDLEAGLKAGVGTNPDSAGPNPYGFGLGGRAGIGILSLYAGVSAIHYFGSSTSVLGVSTDLSTTLLGGELGYTISSIPVIQIRPQIGVGNAAFAVDSVVSSSSSYLYLEPGLTVLIPLGLLYVGADANALIIPSFDRRTAAGTTSSETLTSLTLHGQIGVRF